MRPALFSFPAFLLLLSGSPALLTSQTTPPFSITAANVTLVSNSSGGSSAYTVASIPLTGGLVVTCAYSGPATTARMPACGHGLIAQIQVTAGQTVTGTVAIDPYATPTPADSRLQLTRMPQVALLGGALLLGLGLRRRTWRGLGGFVFACGAAAMLFSVGACGGSRNPFAMTAGTYAYTLTASNSGSGVTPLGVDVSTTFTVTVP